MFADERKALEQRLGPERGMRVLQLVVALDVIERQKSAGLKPWQKPPRGSADQLRAELRRVLELSDDELNSLAGVAEDAARRVAKAYPPPTRN